MNQNNRFCTQQWHEQLQVNQICTYKGCIMNRWCCLQCLSDDIHKHSMSNSNHIMNQAKLSSKVKQDIQILKNEYLQSKQGTNKKITRQQLATEFQDIFKLQELIQKMEGQNFIKINDEDINKLLNINQHQFNLDVKLQLQDSNCQGKQDSNRQGQNHQQYQENNNKKIIDFKSRKYEIQKIYQNLRNKHLHFASSLISRNEQYIVYNTEKAILVYDLKMNKNYKTLKQKRQKRTFQYTNDSKILFAGDSKGFVNGYFVKTGFKIFYKQKIHQDAITQIIIQKQYLITASVDESIIKTNFIKKTSIFKLCGSSVFSFDYDDLKDRVVSTTRGRILKVWDCLTQSILFEHTFGQYDRYGQIQLINNKQDILKCGFSGFQKFAIDYQNKKLIEIYSYRDNKLIFRFQQVNNDQNILLIFKYYCMILNQEGKLIVKYYHKLHLDSINTNGSYRQQLDNLNYIVLQDNHQLYLLRAKYKN